MVNKQAGVLVHPVPGSGGGDKRTLVEAMLAHCGADGLSGINGMEASCTDLTEALLASCWLQLLAAKTDLAHALLAAAWYQRRVQKQYMAVVQGKVMDSSGEVTSMLGG